MMKKAKRWAKALTHMLLWDMDHMGPHSFGGFTFSMEKGLKKRKKQRKNDEKSEKGGQRLELTCSCGIGIIWVLIPLGDSHLAWNKELKKRKKGGKGEKK